MSQGEKEPKRVKTKEEMEQLSSVQQKSEVHDNKEDKSERNDSKNSEVNTTINGNDADEEKKNKKDTQKKVISAVAKAYIGDVKGAVEDAKAAKEDADVTEKDEDDENNDVMENAKKALQITQALQTAYKLFMTLQLLAWLKYMLTMLTQMIVAAIKAFWGWLAGVVTKAWGMIKVGFATATGFLAQTLGISTVTSAAILMLGGVSGIGGVVVAGITIYNTVAGPYSAKHIAEKDAVIEDDCAEDTINSVSGSSIDGGLSNDEVSKITNENATKVYSLFKQYGLAEENIAGIIGNFSAESGIDATTIEGIYDEDHNINGKRKLAAASNWQNYTLNTLFPLYQKTGVDINKKAYIGNDKKYYPALGLGQWTGPRATLLLNYAKNLKTNWFNIDAQLAFMITDPKKGGDTRSGYFSSWKPVSDPEIGADEFAKGWEGHDPQQGRRDAAASWFTKMQNGKLVLDKNYGESIIAAAGTTAQAASDTATAEKAKTCNDLNKLTVDNSSIASAAISLCYPYSTFKSGSVRKHSDWGTQLYQEVNNAIHKIKKGSGGQYRDCGKYVRTVIKWCGADKDYSNGCTADQYTYLSSSKKWEEIDWQGNYENLSPGDILITRGKGHVCIYVGYEAIATVYPDTPDNEKVVICSASKDGSENGEDGYPACCRNFYDGLSQFAAFRCVKPDNDTTYKDVGTNTAIDQSLNATHHPVPASTKTPESTTKSNKTKKKK